MKRRAWGIKVTDEQVRAILLAPAEQPNVEVAHTLGLTESDVYRYRSLSLPRALSAAKELGLLGPLKPLARLRRRSRHTTTRAQSIRLIEAVMAGDA